MSKKVLSILPARGLEAVYLDDDQSEFTGDIQAIIFWQDTEDKIDKGSVSIRLVTSEDISMGFVSLDEGAIECKNFKGVRDKSTRAAVSEVSIIERQMGVQVVK